MQQLSDELKKETGLTYTGDVPTSYAAVVEAMCAERVDVGWVSPLAYILAREKCGADMSLVSITRVGTNYWGAIVTRADSPIRTVEDLKGKRFAWVDPSSTSGYLFPRAMLQEHGVTPESAGAAGVRRRTRQGRAGHPPGPGGRWRDGVGLDPAAQLDLSRTPSRSCGCSRSRPDIPNDGVAFRKGLSPEIVQKTREALLRISSREDGQKLFEEAIGTRGVAPTTDAAYEPVRRAASVLGMDLESELSKPK